MILGTGAFKNILGNTFLIVVMLLCLCVSSWGASCESGDRGVGSYYGSCATDVEYSSNGWYFKCSGCYVDYNHQTCGSLGDWEQYYCTHNYCQVRCECVLCDNKDATDSLFCELYPDAEGCANACTADKNECEAAGGVWEGNPTSDSTCTSTCDVCNTPFFQEMRNYTYNACCSAGLTPQFSCGFTGIPIGNNMLVSGLIMNTCNTTNWETEQICNSYYSSSAEQELSSSSSQVESSSSVSEYCLLFPTELECKCAVNPDSPDCDYLNSSGSEGSSGSGEDSSGSEGSSGSGGEPCVGNGCGEGSSGSGGAIGGSGDWEYDYRDSLHRIINATSKTANNTNEISTNTSAIKNLLQQARCLFTDCTDYDQLKMAFDTNMVIPNGDTAGVLGSMEELWDSTAMAEFIRGAEGGDIYGINGDSVNDALGELGDKFGSAFGDTGGVYGEMANYQEMIEENFPTAQWSYTEGCPTVLTERLSFNIPPVGVVSTDKSLGTYFCEPLPPLNVTAGNMARAIIRLVLTITMAFGIFKAATGVHKE